MSKDNLTGQKYKDPVYEQMLIDLLTGPLKDEDRKSAIFHLINVGVNVNAKDPQGNSALGLAICFKHDSSIIYELLKAGANPDAGLSYISEAGTFYTSPLSLTAHQTNDTFIAYLLLEHKANINGNGGDDNPLNMAIGRQHTDLAKYLISKGANTNNPKTIYSAISSNDLELVRLLVEKGADIKDNELYKGFIPPLVQSVHERKEAFANYLLQQGATIDFNSNKLTFDLSEPWIRNLLVKTNYPYLDFINSFNLNEPVNDLLNIINSLPTFAFHPNHTNIAMIVKLINKVCEQEKVKETILSSHNGKTAGKYLNLFKLKHTFKNNKFVLTTHLFGNESSSYVVEDIKEKCRTVIKDGKLYLKSTGELLDSKLTITTLADVGALYVVNKNGDLFVNAKNYEMRHSYFLPGSKEKTKLENISMYGYGKPVACGGLIKFEEGLISKITNGSGHYAPNTDQLKLVCKYFYDQNLLSPHVEIVTYDNATKLNLESIETLVAGDILAQYPAL